MVVVDLVRAPILVLFILDNFLLSFSISVVFVE